MPCTAQATFAFLLLEFFDHSLLEINRHTESAIQRSEKHFVLGIGDSGFLNLPR
jgi:hypothetical protein